MARITDIADNLTTALNAESFSMAFTAQRAYRPAFELKDLATLRVTVVPKALELTDATRGLIQNDIQIDVGVQKKLDAVATESAQADALMGLVEEMADFIQSSGTFGGAQVISVANDPIYAPEHFDEVRVFTSVLTVTLRGMVQR